jgi:hypothetical protein
MKHATNTFNGENGVHTLASANGAQCEKTTATMVQHGITFHMTNHVQELTDGAKMG